MGIHMIHHGLVDRAARSHSSVSFVDLHRAAKTGTGGDGSGRRVGGLNPTSLRVTGGGPRCSILASSLNIVLFLHCKFNVVLHKSVVCI